MTQAPEASARISLSAACVYGGASVVLGALVWSLITASGASSPGPTSAEPPTEGSPAVFDTPLDARLVETVGTVLDADLIGDVWYLLDGHGGQVHRFDMQGMLLGSFAGEGDGPDELRSPRALAVRADTIVVATRRSLHLYKADGIAILDRRLEPPKECVNSYLSDIAASPSGLLLLYYCRPENEIEALVMLETGEATYRRLAVRRGEPQRRGHRVAFREMAVLSSHPRGFLFGHPNDACLDVFDLNGWLLESVCHEWIDRHPLPEPTGEEWDEVLSGLRSVGMAVEIPDHYPPFDRVFVVNGGGLVYRSPTVERIDISRLVTHGRDLSAMVPPASAVFTAGNSVLAAWYPLAGTRIMVYDTGDWP